MKRSCLCAVATLVLATTGPIRAQDAPRSKEAAAVIVDGAVRDVFRSARPEQADALVQIDVARTELGRAPADVRRPPIPAPGDPVYVHVPRGDRPIPPVGSAIRAYLAPRPGGGWQGASSDWFDLAAEPDVAARPAPSPTPGPSSGASSASGKTILGDFGVKADPVEASGRLVLKITDVLPDTPAQKAGFEKGDVIIGVNKSGFASLQQFADLLSQGPATAELAVLNVRTNEQAAVPVDVTGIIKQGPPRRPAPSPNSPVPTPPKRSLGIEVEPVRLGLKVTEVRQDGPARKAGFEVGDVLVEAGGAALTDEARLQEAVDKAGATLTVTVRDSRTGKNIPVEVSLGAPEPSPRPTPLPSPAPEADPAPGGGLTSRRFGLTVKPGTADLLPVVKVAAVAPGSPADRAGLQVGDAIVGVDDRVVFAPDLFEEALKGVSKTTFTLTVLDVKSGKKTPVKVDLQQR
ncbi:PDZ domain-containing protein [Planctomyces sp. SH-PL62]|uniref:PDZ domain-containing protein n=1 Tax=Planctomyces sp. SH-PL62 TaxID=1636152 RepID=UPI00078D940B|nr:PDZ domain-containing protein [Planctomyces sp. SH-PL62]AMV38487.1 putative periplasmic serine endoprotease DegP-like precursor [Planctomyces sp. SH-PL62]